MENIERLKSSRCSEEDQLEMMLLMQMEKLPAELLEQQAYGHDPADTSMMMDFSGGSGGSSSSCSPTSNHNTTMANLFHDNINNVQLHPSLLNPPISSTTPLPTSGTTCDGAAGVMMTNWRYGPSGTAAVPNSSSSSQLNHLQNHNSMAAMREMIFRIAAMQPIYIDPESVKPPKRRNVKISKDPQSVAARHRRERISERIRILQRLVPGGTKMDTASMLDEAIHYVKFLKTQVQSLERAAVNRPPTAMAAGVGFPVAMNTSSVEGYGGTNNNSFPLGMKKRHHNHPLLVPGGFHHQQQHHFSSDA